MKDFHSQLHSQTQVLDHCVYGGDRNGRIDSYATGKVSESINCFLPVKNVLRDVDSTVQPFLDHCGGIRTKRWSSKRARPGSMLPWGG